MKRISKSLVVFALLLSIFMNAASVGAEELKRAISMKDGEVEAMESKTLPYHKHMNGGRSFSNWMHEKQTKDGLYATWKEVPLEISGIPLSVNNNDSFTLKSNQNGSWSSDGEYFKQTVYLNNKAIFVAKKAGKSFIKFYAVSGEIRSIEIEIKETHYDLTFNSNGGIGSMEDMSLAYNEEKMLEVNNFTREDYTFEGWAISESDAEQQIVTYLDAVNYHLNVRGNQTLYAVWKPVQIEVSDMPEIVQVSETFEVVLSTNEGSLDYDETYFKVETETTRSIPIGNKVKFTALEVGTTTITFTANNGSKVEKEVEIRNDYYSVSFNENGGEGTLIVLRMPYNATDHLPINEYIRKDYTFVGWSFNENAITVDYEDGDSYTHAKKEDVTLYAMWEPIQIVVSNVPEAVQVDEDFEVTLNTEAIGTIEYEDQYFEMTTNIVSFVPIGNKVRFKALKAGETILTFISSNGTKIMKTIEIRENFYKVSFDENGGVGTMEAIDFIFKEEKRLSKNLFVKEGFVFEGWATSEEEADKGNVTFLDEAMYTMEVKEARTLYAVWIIEEIQLSELPIDIMEEGTFTITSNVMGQWSFDTAMLEIVEQNEKATTFRALKAGTVELVFSANNGREASKSIIITGIEETQVPIEPPTQTSPMQSGKPEVSKDLSIPETGDVTNIGLFVLIMSVSSFVMRRKLKR